MIPGNDLWNERGPHRSPDPLGRTADAPVVTANRPGGDQNGTATDGGGGVGPGPATSDDRGPFPEAAQAQQLVESVRSATDLLEHELAQGLTDEAGWAGALVRIRAAAATQRAIAEAESQLVALRQRAAAQLDAAYEPAARRAEELLLAARSTAATLVQEARAGTARLRKDAEAGAQLVRSEAEGAAATILGEADREAGSRLAAAELTLREQIAAAEKEAALILQKSQEQAAAWMAETKQACVEMVSRARQEADRTLQAARQETAGVWSDVRREPEDVAWRPVGPEEAEAANTALPNDPLSRRPGAGMASSEPLIGSRGATTAFGDDGPVDGPGDTAHQDRTDRDAKHTRPGGRRRRFRS